tara:strand:+ start:20005 stop:21114 length:1110 start_codon:yes stop_codon:yes gene_type:complete
VAEIYRYPKQPPVPSGSNDPDVEAPTEAIDYVRFRPFEMQFGDGSAGETGFAAGTGSGAVGQGASYSSGGYGYGLANVNATKIFKKEDIYMAMPPNLQTGYQANYRQVDIGAGGVALAGMMGSGGDYKDIAGKLQDAAKAALPEFSASIITNAANDISGFLGMQGNIDVNSLEALTRGRVFNPYTEQIFNSMSFRNHNFSFKMFSRNDDEAVEIQKIIRAFKMHSHPDIQSGKIFDHQGGNVKKMDKDGDSLDSNFLDEIAGTTNSTTDSANANRFFKIPCKWEIDFMRMDPNRNSFTSTNAPGMHFKVMPSVCTGISVNYTPDNQYVAFKRTAAGDTGKREIQVPAIVLNIAFTETKLLTQKDIEFGA